MSTGHGPWIDLHAHPGRSFLAGLPDDHPLSQMLRPQEVAAAHDRAERAGLSAVSLSTVSDLMVLAPDAERGFRAARPFRPGEAAADHRRQLTGISDVIDRAGGLVAGSASDIEVAHTAGRAAALLTCEGGDFLEDGLELLEEAHGAGVRSLTLVHYRVNAIGDIQTEAPVHGGLTAFGRDVVAEANRLGVLIDCAHATFEVTRDVVTHSTGPVMISHSHLDHADQSHPRLLSDAHAVMVTEAGGVIGAWPAGVVSTTIADYVDEIMCLVELVGIEHVAIGTDMDANYQPVVSAYDELSHVAEALSGRGLSDAEVDRVMGGNALDLIRRVCG